MTLMNTTKFLNASQSTLDSTNWLLKLSLLPIRIVCPLLIILCPIANWICIKVFQSRIYNRSSSKWYFIFIAIFDTIYVLVTAPLIFLLTFEIYILNQHVLLCKLIVFLNYLPCQISAGLLACLSIDRLLATSCLYLYRFSCTANVSKYVCLFVILIFSIVNSHYLIGYNIDSDGFCSVRHYKWYENIYSHLNVVYLLSYSIIPFTIIAICHVFIVISVCRNKSRMKKKYLLRKRNLTSNQPVEFACSPPLASENKEDILTSGVKKINGFQFGPCAQEDRQIVCEVIDNNQIINKVILASNYDRPPPRTARLLEKLLPDGEESVIPRDSSPRKIASIHSPSSSLYRKRSSSTRLFSSPAVNSQKMCVQLQITISLLAISISFIFCTLPNCISTIMIQTHNHNDQVRKFWQAMNYFSIVPLLITHAVNLIFYYLSSNMFRNCLKENYLQKTNSTQQSSLRKLFKS